MGPRDAHVPDSDDCSNFALDDAMASCLAGSNEGCTLFYHRFVRRCMAKVDRAVAAQHPELSAHDRERVLQEVVNDIVTKASAGAISVNGGYTQYFAVACRNRIFEEHRGQKAKEIPFSALKKKVRPNPGRPTESLLLETIAGPGRRPQGVAIEREYQRRIGEQVGALPEKMRDVVVRSRQGLDYVDIARELKSTYETVKAQFSQAVKTLREGIDEDGLIRPARRVIESLKAPRPEDGREGLLGFVQELPASVGDTLELVHFKELSVSDVAEKLKDVRAGVEALLLYGYLIIRKVTEKEFPRDFLKVLPPRSAYRSHQVQFRFW